MLFLPLRFVMPIGWIGVKYRTSKPSSAICGTTLRTPWKPPQERGKSSYQELKRARSRSTLTVAGSGRVPTGLRSGQCSAAAATSGASAASRRCAWSAPVSAARVAASASSAASLPLARSAAAASSRAPSLSSPARSAWPPSSLRWTSWRHEASGSIQASIEYCQVPQASTGKLPSQVSPSTCASIRRRGDSFQRAVPRRYLTTARSSSWPSAKISARTVTVSPTHAFAGWRPQSTSGDGRCTRMRDGGCVLDRTGTYLLPIRSAWKVNVL